MFCLKCVCRCSQLCIFLVLWFVLKIKTLEIFRCIKLCRNVVADPARFPRFTQVSPKVPPPYVLRRLKINRNTMFWNFNFAKFPNSWHLQCRDFKIRKLKHLKISKSQNCKRSRFQDFNISNFKTSNCKWVHSFKNSNFGKVGRIRFEILYRWAQCLTRNALARDALKSATSCKCWGGWFRGISRKWSTCARWPWIGHLGPQSSDKINWISEGLGPI